MITKEIIIEMISRIALGSQDYLISLRNQVKHEDDKIKDFNTKVLKSVDFGILRNYDDIERYHHMLWVKDIFKRFLKSLEPMLGLDFKHLA